MDDTANQVLQGQIRTVLALIAGALAAHGLINSVMTTEIIGIGGALIPIVWSAWAHIKIAHAAKALAATAVNVGIVKADSTVGMTPLVTPAKAAALIEEISPSLPVVVPPVVTLMEAKA